MGIKEKSGIAPEIRELLCSMAAGISGGLSIRVTPATCGSSAAAVATAIASTAAKYQRKVRVEVVDAEGKVADWFNGALSIAATKASTSGRVAINGGGATVTLKDGAAEVTLDYTGTWAAAETQTLTVSGSIAGVTLTQKTSVDTLVA